MEELKRKLTIIGLVIAQVFAAAFALRMGSIPLTFAVVAWPVGVLFFVRPDLMYCTVTALFLSGLHIPGLPGNLQLHQVLIAVMLAISVVRATLQNSQRKEASAARTFTMLFIGIVLVIAASRGTGFRLLGGTTWGGGRYVAILTSAYLFLCSQDIRSRPALLRRTSICLCTLALIPLASQILYVASKGVIHQHLILVSTQGWDVMEKATEGRIARFRGGNIGGQFMLLIPFLLHPFRKKPFLFITLIAIAMLLAMISGHRLAIIINVLFILIYSFVTCRTRRIRYFIISVSVGILLMLLLIPTVHLLPRAFQRAVSWIPFVDVAPDIHDSAQGTIDWRIRVWQEAMSEIPQYWLLGKGYAYRLQDLISLRQSRYWGLGWARLQSAYHNGPLSLLIGTGVPGLLAGFGFMFGALRRHIRLARTEWSDPTMRRMHLVFLVRFSVSVVVFTFLYGDVFVSFPVMFLLASLMEATYRADHETNL
jgi:hypothetical protein